MAIFSPVFMPMGCCWCYYLSLFACVPVKCSESLKLLYGAFNKEHYVQIVYKKTYFVPVTSEENVVLVQTAQNRLKSSFS